MTAPNMPPIVLTELQRRAIMLCSVTATVLASLDMTIANVALPHMQGSLTASQDQMTWVLTSYIVASAVAMPLSGWLANRLSRRTLLLGAITGFVITSALCGLAQNLGEIVVFRTFQGVFGAPLIPIAQALMLDVNPPEKHSNAMAIWTAGALVGPATGPVLGGWLTDSFSWRWVFYINVPIGVATVIGLWVFMPVRRSIDTMKFDLFGFSLLGIAIGAFQIALDRGQLLGWFESTEIVTELVVSAVAFYLFLVHTATTRQPFFSPSLFKDRNFMVGSLMYMAFGTMMFATSALAPGLQQQLLGYPVFLSGVVSTPRTLGSLVATYITAAMLRRGVSARLLVFGGFTLYAVGTAIMSRLSLQTDYWPIVIASVIQGFAAQIAFVPMVTLTYASLNPGLRNEAASLGAVVRNVGASAGISITQAMLVRSTQRVHSVLVENVRPDNPAMSHLPASLLPDTPSGAAMLDGFISRQAAMVAYDQVFLFLALVSLVAAFGVFLMRASPVSREVEIAVE